MLDTGCQAEIISGIPMVAEPAEIHISTAGQLRIVLLCPAAGGGV